VGERHEQADEYQRLSPRQPERGRRGNRGSRKARPCGEYVERAEEIGPAIARAYASSKAGVIHAPIDPKVNSEEMPSYDEIPYLVRGRHAMISFG
jgi:thiamine pyrophosphate-dependent acetolactate synthase large subunit-like protein